MEEEKDISSKRSSYRTDRAIPSLLELFGSCWKAKRCKIHGTCQNSIEKRKRPLAGLTKMLHSPGQPHTISVLFHFFIIQNYYLCVP